MIYPEKQIQIKGIYGIIDAKKKPDFVFEGESHPFWEMVYVDKGQVEVQSEKDTIILKQGEIIFHKPNEFHAIKAHESSPNFFVISFVCSSPSMKYFEKFFTRLLVIKRIDKFAFFLIQYKSLD